MLFSPIWIIKVLKFSRVLNSSLLHCCVFTLLLHCKWSLTSAQSCKTSQQNRNHFPNHCVVQPGSEASDVMILAPPPKSFETRFEALAHLIKSLPACLLCNPPCLFFFTSSGWTCFSAYQDSAPAPGIDLWPEHDPPNPAPAFCLTVYPKLNRDSKLLMLQDKKCRA